MGSGKGKTKRTQAAQAPAKEQTPPGHFSPDGTGNYRWPEAQKITDTERKAFFAKREVSPEDSTFHDVYYMLGDAWLCSEEYLEELAHDPTTPMASSLYSELGARSERREFIDKTSVRS